MKKIIFSTHALLRMAERGIVEREIISAIANPDKVEQSITNSNRFLIKKLYFSKRFQKEHLLLIVTESNQIVIKVITVIDTSKISRHF
ncbi:hypothetical protein COZ78_01580 [bacterium (Candidatus Gribaldobacteria) CG_4_8_14_3_um_filter_42_11]|uniref:DUF4258 domain-containing protein n=2 Tax=Candidatus Gribaldobacteria TaxID=2798536 RepID=A0A2H0V0B2_9BACT|nr:MAG: hypothetical protein COU03_00565 [bacterium (Candidatus Gribaldobacteria) CG10_big_fil_rev_8_21_14_0_10_41_12]PIX03202.1 MAG: hypothetical protein COZ78_01580 [bacterium (Candidatus Gribaldobacteria) CG_4_8_14_3_um_filter_42_11]